MKDFKPVLEAMAQMNYEQQEAFLQTLPFDKDREIVKQTCETFTRLLLSITPFKAKEFVEKNCARVRRKIMSDVNDRTMKKYLKEGEESGNN